MHRASDISAGSLSPRTNWSSLASFEFDLPPLDQQRRIAEILWAVDEIMQQLESKLVSAINLSRKRRVRECSRGTDANEIEINELGMKS